MDKEEHPGKGDERSQNQRGDSEAFPTEKQYRGGGKRGGAVSGGERIGGRRRNQQFQPGNFRERPGTLNQVFQNDFSG